MPRIGRRGAATLAMASRTDLKVIRQMLGHSSIVTTADTYTSVLPEAAHRAAQARLSMLRASFIRGQVRRAVRR
jgi:integrase